MENNNKVKSFYENYKEEGREERETIEFLRSKNIISRYLTEATMEIADISGAAGAYSFWLANKGHRVHLLDLVEKHINSAKARSLESGIALASYTCADARELPYECMSMDLALLMGALYHLHSPESRVKCLLEVYRILKPGGLIICTVISRYTALIATMKYKIFDIYNQDYLEKTLETGIHKKANFYMHTPNEIISEMSCANFDNIKLIAVEGIASVLGDNQLPQDEGEAARLLWCIELLESKMDIIGASRNIIAVGKRCS